MSWKSVLKIFKQEKDNNVVNLDFYLSVLIIKTFKKLLGTHELFERLYNFLFISIEAPYKKRLSFLFMLA